MERSRRWRECASPDRRFGRARNTLLVARRQVDCLCRARRAASRGLCDAGRGRPGAAPDVPRSGRDGAWLDGGRTYPVCHHARPAVFPQLSRVHDRSRGRSAAADRIGSGQSSDVRSRQGARDRAQHRGSRTLEALPRRYGGPLVDRRAGQWPVPPHDRIEGEYHQSDVDRWPRLFPVGRGGRGQHLLVSAGRQGAAAAHRPRRFLRAARANRRHPHRVPVRRADLVPRHQNQQDTRGGHSRAGSSRPGGAAVCARSRLSAGLQCASGRPQHCRGCAGQAVQFRLVGGRGPAMGRRRWSSPARAMVGRWHHVHHRQRCVGRGAARSVPQWCRQHNAVGYRPRGGHERRATRRDGGLFQSSQRSDRGQHRHRRHACR